MSQTPASGTSSYASNADMTVRADWRSLAQYLPDANVPYTQAQVLASTTLTTLLQEASGMVEAAAQSGNRYRIDPTATPPINDLAALTGNSQQLLIGLVCDLALWLIWNRKPSAMPKPLPGRVEIAFTLLDKLNKGEWIFGLLESQNAGTLSDYVDLPEDVERRYLPVVVARPYFGRRSNQYFRPGGR